MDVFKYDEESSYEQNFTRWHSMNSSERRQFNEEVLSVEDARSKFEDMHKEEIRGYAATILSKAFS